MRVNELDSRLIPYRLVGAAALHAFFQDEAPPFLTIETTIGLVELSAVFDEIAFPGLPGWDALITTDEARILVRCVDTLDPSVGSRHPLIAFARDPYRRAFADPHGLYETLREARARLTPSGRRRRVDPTDVDPVSVSGLDAVHAAILAARLPLVPAEPATELELPRDLVQAPGTWHRIVLEQVLTGRFAWRGMEILNRSGYLAEVLPELAPMDHTDHSKEGHPEGNVWRHSLETLKYRKSPDFAVSLALLLHDAGKPYAEPEGNRRFNRHAEIGADLTRRLLRRLDLAEEEVDAVAWLVRFHMIPGAIERLPDHRRDPVMASALFPQLLEVYRCDLSSTYRGPDGYYRACRVYRRYLKRARRADRGPAPRRLVELYVD